jgi:hypothetical protein
MLAEIKYKLFGKKVAAELSETEFYDADWLLDNHIISISAVGRTITEIDLDVQNLSDRKLKVLMPRGVYFPARGGHQNMVNTREVVFRLKPQGSKFVAVQVACLNANLEIPGADDNFHGIGRARKDVTRFIEAARNESPMVLQAGIWALTDGLNRLQLKERLVNESGPRVGRHSISDSDIDTAGLILAKLHLSTRIS